MQASLITPRLVEEPGPQRHRLEAAGDQAAVGAIGRASGIDVDRLRVELAREGYDFRLSESPFARDDALALLQVVEVARSRVGRRHSVGLSMSSP